MVWVGWYGAARDAVMRSMAWYGVSDSYEFVNRADQSQPTNHPTSTHQYKQEKKNNHTNVWRTY